MKIVARFRNRQGEDLTDSLERLGKDAEDFFSDGAWERAVAMAADGLPVTANRLLTSYYRGADKDGVELSWSIEA